jgi:hypothetical protein
MISNKNEFHTVCDGIIDKIWISNFRCIFFFYEMYFVKETTIELEIK